MPLSGTPAPNKRKKSTKLIMELTALTDGEHDASRLNLGKKISVPRDIMLEELSLLSNKGSKMFKLRQKRVEKFIWENNPDVFTDNSLLLSERVQLTTCQIRDVKIGHQHWKICKIIHVHDGQSGQPGSEGGKQITIFKTYLSPWDKALGTDPQQATKLSVNLLDYGSKAELSKFKSFNRSAMPYGGYEKASKLMTFQMPEFDAGPEPEDVTVFNPNVNSRPSFNRTPIGWLGSGDTTNYNIELNAMPVDGETDEL
ncbi:PREDICTED: myozenin-1 [Nanorana parkeri]|uniref:myozenin-1 n=1 Tax=Nanorana parkeri TaxID=125878 RepID=UPI0008548989|nr:PREDICTED: myozenin-1 [Nanorana parkeri]